MWVYINSHLKKYVYIKKGLSIVKKKSERSQQFSFVQLPSKIS